MSPAATRRPPQVTRVLRQITQTARRHSMFDPGSRVLVAVSGGPDSVCLLHSLVRLRRLFGIEPICFHFDHRLRADSAADASYVRGQAKQLGVPFVLRGAESRPARGESVEAWARTVRYGAIAAVREEFGAAAAAVGHTADDQAETVLLALVRGGGLEALAGMAAVSRPLVRPLLETTREDTVAFCRALRLRTRRDPMNENTAFSRVAIRTGVIPELERILGRKIRPTLARTAELLRHDEELLRELARRAAGEVLAFDGDSVRMDPERLASLPPALAGRVVRHALLSTGVVPEAAQIESVVDLAAGRTGRRISLPGGLIARRSRGYVALSRSSPGRSARWRENRDRGEMWEGGRGRWSPAPKRPPG